MSTTVRVNAEIKKEVTPILDSLGISLSEAINMFLYQVRNQRTIPFELKPLNYELLSTNDLLEVLPKYKADIEESFEEMKRGEICDASEVDW